MVRSLSVARVRVTPELPPIHSLERKGRDGARSGAPETLGSGRRRCTGRV